MISFRDWPILGPTDRGLLTLEELHTLLDEANALLVAAEEEAAHYEYMWRNEWED